MFSPAGELGGTLVTFPSGLCVRVCVCGGGGGEGCVCACMCASATAADTCIQIHIAELDT